MACIYNKKPADRHCEYCSAVCDERPPKSYKIQTTNTIKPKDNMDYKEKYEQALERARIWRDKSGMPKNKQGILDDIFPELAESEDERIREWLICYFKEVCDNVSEKEKKGVIAWLEKQCEQKPILPKWKYKNDNTPLLRDSLILNKYGCVAKSPSGALVSDVWVIDYDELVKLPKEEYKEQGEQKPAKFDDTNAKRMFIKALERVEEQNNKGYKLTDCDKNSWWEDFKAYTSCIIEQKPWSEEDEAMQKTTILYLENTKDSCATACVPYIVKCINWLKSLKPQSTWKPSEEQMNALSKAIAFVFDSNSDVKHLLESLYNELKKL